MPSPQVLLMVWDDATNNMGLHSGLMATHDQETVKFFKDTKVKCFLCPRAGGTEDSYLQVCEGVHQQLAQLDVCQWACTLQHAVASCIPEDSGCMLAHQCVPVMRCLLHGGSPATPTPTKPLAPLLTNLWLGPGCCQTVLC
jgi:hypothetical protein